VSARRAICRDFVRGDHVDSDLADAVETLKAIFAKRKLPCSFGKAPQATVDELRKQLRVPSRYRSFLLAADPEKVETVTPVERIRLIPAEELVKTQALVQTPGSSGAAPLDWKTSWVVIGESSLLGDPYFLDVGKLDAEGDCPVYTAMSGQERWNAVLAASSFALVSSNFTPKVVSMPFTFVASWSMRAFISQS